MYKAAIFDLDGTLLDTIADIGDSTNLALKELGYPEKDIKEYKLLVGNGFINLVRKALPESASGDEKIVESTLWRFQQNYSELYMNKTRPYDGIEELIKELHKKGVPMAVDSNKRESFTVNLINKFFPENCFKMVLGEAADRAKKPDPISVNIILEKLGVTAKETLFIGDTKVDIQTGKNAGLATAGVLWGFRDISELQNEGADYIIKQPSELLDLLR